MTLPQYTPSQLVERSSMKWTRFPNTIGAFVAEADFGVAPPIHKALEEMANKELFAYTPEWLLKDVQRATSDFYSREYEWNFPPEDVSVIPDVVTGFVAAMNFFSEPDRPIVVMTPAYMPFLSAPERLNRRVIEVPMKKSDGEWRADLPALRNALQSGGLLVLCNPHNPIGKVYLRQELASISEVVSECGARVFSDEIHSPLIHGNATHVPYASISTATAAHTVTSTSASKTFNIPGLKCAQLIFSNEADKDRWAEVGYFTSHTTASPGMVANIAAYDDGGPWLKELLSQLRRNTELFTKLVAEKLPLADYLPPVGTYLAWLDLTAYGCDDSIAERLRKNARLSVTNGRDCGEIGSGCVRVNLATPEPIVTEIVDRIAQEVAE